MKNLAMPFRESQVTFDLRGYEHFAFENCPAYQRRSAHQLAEMDIGWYEPANQALYIAELKDFSVSFQAPEPNLSKRATDLFHKSLSVIAMLTAVRLGTATAHDIAPCLPPSWPALNPVYLLHIIHCSPHDEQKLLPLQRKLEEFMKPQYLQLFNIVSCTILSHRQAKTQFPDIIS